MRRLLFASVLVLLALALAYFTGSASEEKIFTYHQSLWNEYTPLIETALENPESPEPISLSHISGGIVPHHIPTTIPELLNFYRGLKAKQTVKNFIILGPDHTNAGQTPITVSAASFLSTYGELKPIPGLAEKLSEEKIASIEEEPFDNEHSIGTQTLLISRLFPEARLTPIILRSNTSQAEAKQLGEFLASRLDKETVLIASVDFSHYLTPDQAAPLDQLSGAILNNFDSESINLVEADSNAALLTFLTAMKTKQALATANLQVLNTEDFVPNSDYTTGYVFGYWGMK